MRAIDCACGQHLEAETDEGLAPLVRQHVRQAHPDMQMTEEEMRGFIARQSHDAAPQQRQGSPSA